MLAVHHDSREGELYKFGGYEVLLVRGENDQAIISFSGIGNVKKGIMSFEWRGSLDVLCPRHHVMYIRDLNRSWFNNKDGFEELIGFIRKYLAEIGSQRLITIGLSMGGVWRCTFLKISES